MLLENKNIQTAYFIGIGGIGMSAIARYFLAHGIEVSGYDRTRTALTATLEAEGMTIHFTDSPELVPSAPDLVVYTPAVPTQMAELQHCVQAGFDVKKRAEVLGMITAHTRTLAVAGTHGKTTTSSMVAHIMEVANTETTSFLGGIATNYNSNLVLHTPTKNTVVEADEYDRSFLRLHPDLAIITSMDADHLDIYGGHEEMQESFTRFAELVSDQLLLRQGLKLKREVTAKVSSYALEVQADYRATNMRIEDGKYIFDLESMEGNISGITLGIPGRHNVENAVAAIAVTRKAGVDGNIIREALGSFKGIRRRFEYVIDSADLVFIDDYAHHPEELKACITSVRELYPDRKITGIFQPHLYTRTRDFADAFAGSLDLLDAVILLPIYPAREQPIEGISSEMLLQRMKNLHKISIEKHELINHLKTQPIEVLLTLGAGDIDALVPQIKDHYAATTLQNHGG